MLTVSSSVNLGFIATVILAIALFYLSTRRSIIALTILVGWAFVQSAIGYAGFYSLANTVPPRFVLMILPPVAFIVLLFLTKAGKSFIDNLEIKWLTLIHLVRLPIEIVLYELFLTKAIPQVMTFEGRNFDIIMGVSAPLVFYFSFIAKKLSDRILLAWNILGIILVLNVAITGILSSPIAFQQFAFEQPNIAVLHFPYNLLPALVVPLVLFGHFASIRKIVRATFAVKRNDNANVIVFPPLLFISVTALALVTKLVFPAVSLPILIQQAGYVFMVVGFLILIASVRKLNKHKTTVHPDGVTTSIVSSGIFKYSRNPIYISFTLVYLGIVLLSNSVVGLVLLVPLLIITQKRIIEREEEYLLKKFGEEYAHYKSTVGRWF